MQEDVARLTKVPAQVLVVGVAGHEDDARVGPDREESLHEFLAADPRHHDVREQEVDRTRRLVGKAECLVAVRGLDDPVSAAAQHAREGRTDRRFILDEQDRLASRRQLGAARWAESGLWLALRLGNSRQDDVERAPLLLDAPHPDRAASAAHDRIARGEAESGSLAGRLGREEGLEEQALDLG